ncbi:MAG: hypothetical protein ABIJ50_05100 [Pseudomonadota bacterium]
MDTARIQKILALHFHPQKGTPFWLERQQHLGLDVSKKIRSRHDFHRLGVMDVAALRSRPITDFIPKSLHQNLSSFFLSETGGTTGDPCRRVFSPEEFHTAFIGPWLKAVAEHNFPRNGRWLFVGPGGPHIIDRSARHMARGVGSLEPFTVDCDVRWIKRQAPGSLGLKLYMDHVLAQAANIISHQEIDTLFTTPPLLVSLARIMTPAQRDQIRGIHTGGMALDHTTAMGLQEQFQHAVILPGYGNSLFGVTFPQLREQNDEDVFQVQDPALWLQLAPLPADARSSQDLTSSVAPGLRGRVVFHRLDESFLIINLVERDTALAVNCPNGELGLSHIAPLEFATPLDRQGVY